MKHSMGSILRLLFTWPAVVIALICVNSAYASPVTLDFTSWVQDRDKAIIQAFETAHPDIKINYRFNYGQEELLVQTIAGEGPDVMTVSWAMSGDYMRAGMFANLSPYIKADSQEIQLDDIFAAALAPGQLNGIQYSLPNALGVQGLYLNTDLFQKSGLNLPAKNWSWEDFAATAKRLTLSDSSGKKVQWGWQNNAVASDFAQWMSIVYAYGGQVLSSGFTAPAFNTPQTVTGLKLLQKMTYQDAVIGGGFPAGTAAMMIRPAETVSSWLAKASFQWQGFPLPQGPARTALMGGAHQLAINAASRNKEAAWEFVKFYVSKSGQEVAAKFPTVPFRRSMFSIAVKYNPGVAVLLQQMDNWTQYTNRLHNQINTIWVPVMKDLYTGSVSPEQAASAINDHIAAIW